CISRRVLYGPVAPPFAPAAAPGLPPIAHPFQNPMGLFRFLLVAATCIAAGLTFSCHQMPREHAAPLRAIVDLPDGWHFHFGAEHGSAALAGAVAGWPEVRLPHTWNA